MSWRNHENLLILIQESTDWSDFSDLIWLIISRKKFMTYSCVSFIRFIKMAIDILAQNQWQEQQRDVMKMVQIK